MSYKALLFHPEGDNVTDFRGRATKQEVWAEIGEMGSKWIFYPIPVIVTDGGKVVVDAPDGLKFFIGKRVKTLRALLKAEWDERKDEICLIINEGLPLSHVYSFD
jgi:hypothetical protein